jgi:hypothetical protein
MHIVSASATGGHLERHLPRAVRNLKVSEDDVLYRDVQPHLRVPCELFLAYPVLVRVRSTVRKNITYTGMDAFSSIHSACPGHCLSLTVKRSPARSLLTEPVPGRSRFALATNTQRNDSPPRGWVPTRTHTWARGHMVDALCKRRRVQRED